MSARMLSSPVVSVQSLSNVLFAAKNLHDFLCKNSGDSEIYPIEIRANNPESAKAIALLMQNLSDSLKEV